MKESSWFSAKYRALHKNKGPELENPMIGILSFEVSRLMCKVANLWHCLSDRHMSLVKEELRSSLGIRTLVSDDHTYLLDLALAEIVDKLKHVAGSVTRFGKKCLDPIYHNLDNVFDNPFEIDLKWSGWEYKLKKMEKRVKKMKKFVAVMLQLHEELEALSDVENRLTRMQANGVNQGQLQEFQQKVAWQREEVNGLREMSPWVRSYDYIVRLLLRSLLTIVERIKVVFGISPETGYAGVRDLPHGGCFVRKGFISSPARASVYPSEGSFKRPVSKIGHTPILCGRHPSTKWQRGKNPYAMLQNDCFGPMNKRQINVQDPTLGSSALALRYANIIIYIETLATSPRFMSSSSRDGLYDMLTKNIKHLLREKLFFSKKEAKFAYDEAVASDRRSSFERILDWLSPLAHNMIKWYTERNFEKQPMGSGGSVLLVQTLYYADQATSEIAITELLVGLHYVSRFRQNIIDKSFIGSA